MSPSFYNFFFFKSCLFCFMNMSVLLACTHVYCVSFWYLQRLEKGVRLPGTRVIDGCDPPCRKQKSSSGLPQERWVLPAISPAPLFIFKRRGGWIDTVPHYHKLCSEVSHICRLPESGQAECAEWDSPWESDPHGHGSSISEVSSVTQEGA